jgi:putative Mg2+ transporter-C (MgtC) family protein
MINDIFNTYFAMNTFTWPDILLRLFLAALFGLFIGLDRDNKDKPVDFRVYIIVCMTTTVITIMGQELNSHYGPAEQFMTLDLGKIIAGIMTGIGFLGAGAIIKKENERVIGTATGASIWAAGGMGLCLGFGLYGLAFMLFGSLALTLYIIGKVVAKLSKNTKRT